MKTQLFKFNNGWEIDLSDYDSDYRKDLSGRIIADWNEPEEIAASWREDGEVTFFCGPEEDGHLSDLYSVDEQLNNILPFASIGDAENFHSFTKEELEEHVGREFSLIEAQQYVRNILESNGITFI